MPSQRRQRGIAMAIAAGAVVCLIAVAILVPMEVGSISFPFITTTATGPSGQTVSSFSLPVQLQNRTDSIQVTNSSIVGGQGVISSPTYKLTLSITNSGTVGVSELDIAVSPLASAGVPASGPNCTFSQTINTGNELVPDGTVHATCIGSPFLFGQAYNVNVTARYSTNPGVASWESDVEAT